MEDSMDMYTLRPQSFLSSCELKAEKDHQFKVDNDENEHQLSYKGPQEKVKLDEDDEYNNKDDEDEVDEVDDFDDEEAEEKSSSEEICMITPSKNAQKSNQNAKDLKPSTLRSNGKQSFRKQNKIPKTPKVPCSAEDIKAKIQASIEKGSSRPKVEAKFINYEKICFRMIDQEAAQELWQWRKSL
ncbi:hypothetical protein ACRRTK_001859 [Alexandromys fortis]